MKKLLSVLLALMLMISCLAGCSTTESKKYYCTTSGHTSSYIRLDKGDTETTGTGYAYKVSWSKDMWSLSGNFNYSSNKVTMTNGIYRGQEFTSGISMNYNASSITFAAISYNC